MTYKIEKNVDIPEIRGANAIFAESMEHGDSVVVESNRERLTFAQTINKVEGFKAVTRKEGDGYRVWKVREGQE